MSGIDVITEDLQDHPCCPHGPTLLFSRLVSVQPRNFFACSACRDKKDCTFFLWEDEKHKVTKTKQDAWQQERDKFIAAVDHKKAMNILLKVNVFSTHIRKNTGNYEGCFSMFEWFFQN